MNIGLFMSNDDQRKQMIEDLQFLFNSNDVFDATINGINVDASLLANIKTPARLESIITQYHPIEAGNLVIIEWKNMEDEILVTSDRTIFVSSTVCKLSVLQCFPNLIPFLCSF